MVNTKNFFLYLLCVGFLILAITVTVMTKGEDEPDEGNKFLFTNDAPEGQEYIAKASDLEVISREAHLTSMRDKISQTKGPASETQKVNEVEEAEETSPVPAVAESLLAEVNLCSDYVSISKPLLLKDVKFEIVEGARLVYRDLPIISPDTTSTSSEAQLVPIPNIKEVYIQLPLVSFPQKTKNCLPYDVIGIALDGSMMRNNELGLYSVFGSKTMIGYALDGFPIYGKNDSAELDECGGAMFDGQYVFYLKSENKEIVKCFSGTPVRL